MDDEADYDYEAILETLEKLYRREGRAAALDLLVAQRFPRQVVDDLMAVLDELASGAGSAYFDS
jgi:cytosine/adenosine deaminase-related metal-dependent hydrolase